MAVIGIIFGIIAFAVAVAGFVATIIILVEAFKTSVTDGLLSLLVPFYIMYFMFAKLQHSKKTLLIVLFMIPAFFLPVLPRWAYTEFENISRMPKRPKRERQ